MHTRMYINVFIAVRTGCINVFMRKCGEISLNFWVLHLNSKPDTQELLYATMTRCPSMMQGAPRSAQWELKTMVREAHKRGIEVILDVVFNHTAEGNELGPHISFRGIDNRR